MPSREGEKFMFDFSKKEKPEGHELAECQTINFSDSYGVDASSNA
jgi:hypothetical protein